MAIYAWGLMSNLIPVNGDSSCPAIDSDVVYVSHAIGPGRHHRHRDSAHRALQSIVRDGYNPTQANLGVVYDFMLCLQISRPVLARATLPGTFGDVTFQHSNTSFSISVSAKTAWPRMTALLTADGVILSFNATSSPFVVMGSGHTSVVNITGDSDKIDPYMGLKTAFSGVKRMVNPSNPKSHQATVKSHLHTNLLTNA